MKPIDPAVLALLATREFVSIDLYTFTLVDNTTILRYSAGDIDIVWSGNTYTSGGQTGPYFDRTDNKAKSHWSNTLQVDTMLFDVIPGSATINGEAFLSAIRLGVFDGAECTRSRAYLPSGSTTVTGVVELFTGRVAEVDASRSLATFTVNSHLELLNQNIPRNMFQAGCVNTLYDASCTLNPNFFKEAGTVASGSTASSVLASLSGASGVYTLGKITFTSGVNNGVSRTVKSYTKATPGTILLISPFPSNPGVGDTFNIFQGCDKSQSTCQNKFGNLVNFRGFPNIPVPETAI